MTSANLQPPLQWRIFSDAEAMARAAAERVLLAADAAIRARGRFRIALAGGTTPEMTYGLLAASDARWADWHCYFGDERCLAQGHTDRNSTLAQRAWLGRVAIPPENVFPIPAELGAEAAAQAYRETVRQALPFDLVLLGMGEDGHTASLFPGQHQDPSELVHPVHGAPKPPPDRVSLSAASLSDAREVLFLISGASKRDAVRRWRDGEPLPAAQIRARSSLEAWLDEAAAGDSLLPDSGSQARR